MRQFDRISLYLTNQASTATETRRMSMSRKGRSGREEEKRRGVTVPGRVTEVKH